MNSEAMKRAREKYRKTKIDTLTIAIPKGSKERWKATATAKGKSLTTYIKELIETDIAKSPQI